jgi:hypothetical protein
LVIANHPPKPNGVGVTIPSNRPIVREPTAGRKLYNQTLGIGFKEENGGYLHTEALRGAKTFALWTFLKKDSVALCREAGFARLVPSYGQGAGA